MIRLRPSQWKKIRKQLMLDYPPSVMLLRYKMREELGFTVREHYEWRQNGADGTGAEWGHSELNICLDFYNDAMESWFQLKYM